jgi:tRNA pseudouridine13 synthase
VPNRFGPQRFGDRRDGHQLGEALVKGAWEEYLSILLGRPRESDTPAIRRSREAYEAGDVRAARRELPPRRADERKALEALCRGGKPERAVRATSKRTRLFQISAFQSSMFNCVLDQRIDAIDAIEEGEYAFKHDSGAVFLVEDADRERPRVARFEISPSGPMFGYKMVMPVGRIGDMEGAVLASHGLTRESFRAPAGMKSKGERRPLRVPLAEPAVAADGSDLVVEFALPPGSYATTVLDEIMKLEPGATGA